MITTTLVMSMLVAYGIPSPDAEMLTCIAVKESNLNPKAINTHNRNGTKDYGLFQINDVNKKLCSTNSSKLLQVDNNLKCAIKVYKYQNLKAWSTYSKCKKEIIYVASNGIPSSINRSTTSSLRPQNKQDKISERRSSSNKVPGQTQTRYYVALSLPRPDDAY